MKFPKNKADVYVVVRRAPSGYDDDVPVGVFPDYDAAHDYAGACAQEWIEKTKSQVQFEVTLSTFYAT